MREAAASLGEVWTVQGLRRTFLCVLLVLTMAATSLGLTDLIRSTDAGDVPPLELIIIMALASAAIVVMWLALEFALAANRWPARLACLAVYVFCMLWSVGFGFGFYWKHLASVDQARTELQAENQLVLAPLHTASSALATVAGRIKTVSDTSAGKQKTEDTDGGSCDNAGSGKGKGDFYGARKTLADKVSALTGDLAAWIDGQGGTPLQADLANVTKEVEDLGSSAADKASADPQSLKAAFEKVETDTTAVIARTNGVIDGKGQYIDRLEELSALAKVGVATRIGPCQDAGLSDSLASAAKTLRDLRPIAPPPFHVRLGTEATKDAFYRIWRNMGAVLLAVVPGIPHPPLSARDRLGESDMVALVAAIVVDIGIAFLTIVGRGRDVLINVENIFSPRRRDARLRREIAQFAQHDPDALRRMLRVCTLDHARRSYLIASEEVPELYAGVRNMQNALVASGDGRLVRLSDPTLLEWAMRRPSQLPGRVRRHLTDVAADLWAEAHSVRSRPPVARTFADHRIRVMRLRPGLVFFLERLLSTLPEPGAEADAAEGHEEPRAPRPGPQVPSEAQRGDLESVLQGWLAGTPAAPARQRPPEVRAATAPAEAEPSQPSAETPPPESAPPGPAPAASEPEPPTTRRGPRRARRQDTEEA